MCFKTPDLPLLTLELSRSLQETMLLLNYALLFLWCAWCGLLAHIGLFSKWTLGPSYLFIFQFPWHIKSKEQLWFSQFKHAAERLKGRPCQAPAHCRITFTSTGERASEQNLGIQLWEGMFSKTFGLVIDDLLISKWKIQLILAFWKLGTRKCLLS